MVVEQEELAPGFKTGLLKYSPVSLTQAIFTGPIQVLASKAHVTGMIDAGLGVAGEVLAMKLSESRCLAHVGSRVHAADSPVRTMVQYR